MLYARSSKGNSLNLFTVGDKVDKLPPTGLNGTAGFIFIMERIYFIDTVLLCAFIVTYVMAKDCLFDYNTEGNKRLG